MSRAITDRIYWGSTVTLSVLMVLSGAGDLLRLPAFVEDTRRLGYPECLMTILGIAKLLGVAALLSPGRPMLKEWAYAGFSFDLGGATISQVVSGSTIVHILPPALCGAVLVVSYPAHRARVGAPPERASSTGPPDALAGLREAAPARRPSGALRRARHA